MPAPTHTTEPRTAPLVQRLLTGGRWRSELADMDYGHFQGHHQPTVWPISTHPVDRAALAVADGEDGALVLGEDDLWRRIDVPGLVAVHDRQGYTSPIVRPTSLSPNADKLALPQPNGLVVVDLADGTSRRYDVPGPGNTYTIWVDSSHVYVAEETARRGTLVDLEDGSLAESRRTPWTAGVGATTLTWGRGGPLHSTLVWGDGRKVRTLGDNGGGFFPQPPLVKDDVVVGVGGIYSSDRGLPFGTTGIVAVDGSTGRVVAYLPLGHEKATTALLLGWDGDNPIIGLPIPQESTGLFVFAWDWRAGELDPIGHVGEWTSWGTGQVR